MNPSTVLGIIGGLLLLILTVMYTAVDYGVFWNVPGLGIVLGGTLAATLASYPLHEVLRVFRVFIIVLRSERYYAKEDMEEIVEVSRQWFKGNLAAIESRLNEIKNPYLRMGIQLVIDDTPLEDVLDLLQWRMTRLRSKEDAEAQVFRTMAMFAPAFGMLGTLVGLINMLFSMQGNDFEHIGFNLAIALITTFYGIILANLVFKPIAIKLERRTEQRIMLMNMVLEGITLMSKGRSPAYIRETLKSFMARYEDEIRQ